MRLKVKPHIKKQAAAASSSCLLLLFSFAQVPKGFVRQLPEKTRMCFPRLQHPPAPGCAALVENAPLCEAYQMA